MGSKKGAMELSVGAIIMLILAVTFLSLGLVFMKSMLGKMFLKLDERTSEEPEPPQPTFSKFISLSRNPIKTTQGEAEVMKISILNPSMGDWANRQFIRAENMCGKADGICYMDVEDTTETCDTENNAKRNDYDCETGLFTGLSCEDNGEKSPCLISNIFKEGQAGGGDMYCPKKPGEASDPDCEPMAGVDIYLSCDKELMEEPFMRKLSPIPTNDYVTNILLLKLNGRIRDDQYLCQLRVFAEDKEYMEDLVVKIENE